MIPYSSGDPERVIAAWVRAWLKKVACGPAEEAFAELDEPNRYGLRCTWDQFDAALYDTAGRGRWRMPVTDPDELPRGGHSRFAALPDGSGWSYCTDLPLEGKWSAFTIQFNFYHRDLGYAVVLDVVYSV